MPPPPAGLKTKSRLAAATAKPAPLTTGWTAKSGIGKGKPVVYELEDSDDEDIPSSSSRKGSTSKHSRSLSTPTVYSQLCRAGSSGSPEADYV